MEANQDKSLRIVGGVCAILWPLLSELLFFGLYPVLAGSSKNPPGSSPETFLRSAAELSQNPAILTLEWGKVAMPLLLLPFLLALYRVLQQRGQRNLIMIAGALGLLGMAFTMLGHTFNSTVNHALGQAYVNAQSETEGLAVLHSANIFSAWHRGINQTGSLLYQGCVGLVSLALIRGKIWRGWGWAGLFGAVLALVAKLTPGLEGITNLAWTGLAYFIWPIALGIALLRVRSVNI